MASRIRTPTLALAGLSMCLTLAMIGTAGKSLHVYYHQRATDPWLLPLWPGHFDSRPLQMLIGASGGVFVLNAILAIAMLVPNLPANAIVLGSAFLSTLVSALSIAFVTILNHRAPYKDTLQTWTCRWWDTDIINGEQAPRQFEGLCHETRFAYWTFIPILVIQVLLFAAGVFAIFARSSSQRHRQTEKHGHQLRDVSSSRNGSSDAKSANDGYNDTTRLYGAAK